MLDHGTLDCATMLVCKEGSAVATRVGGALTIGVVLRENVAQLRTHRDSPGFEELAVANL